jgi:hypothetical protein
LLDISSFQLFALAEEGEAGTETLKQGWPRPQTHHLSGSHLKMTSMVAKKTVKINGSYPKGVFGITATYPLEDSSLSSETPGYESVEAQQEAEINEKTLKIAELRRIRSRRHCNGVGIIFPVSGGEGTTRKQPRGQNNRKSLNDRARQGQEDDTCHRHDGLCEVAEWVWCSI